MTDKDEIVLKDGTRIGLDTPESETLAIMCMCHGENWPTLGAMIDHMKNKEAH